MEQFIDNKVSRFQSRKNRKTRLAVFLEPFWETGFPDVVFFGIRSGTVRSMAR
ncbi:MAG: hypothetical protein K6U80_19400 [Firmicutes bacterium]|nr:hypothetical protein [Bacillota bacterium]